jgi:parvulin-like peptidyl-prolyl isomerase
VEVLVVDDLGFEKTMVEVREYEKQKAESDVEEPLVVASPERKRRVHRWFAICVFSVVAFGGGCLRFRGSQIAPREGADRVIVTVAGETLTQGQQQRMVLQMMVKLGVPPEMLPRVMAQLGPRVVENFIDRALVLAETKRRKIQITADEIDAVFARLASRLAEGVRLEQVAEARGMTIDELRNDAIKDEMARKLFEAETASVAGATDGAVESFYTNNLSRFIAAGQTHVRHVLIGCADSEGEVKRIEARAKAEEIRKALLNGGDFEAVAREHSTCLSSSNGGYLSSFPRGSMVREFEAAAFSQATDTIGEVVETSFGYHIIEVLDRSDTKTNSLDEVAGDLKVLLTRQNRDKAFQEFTASLREGADIVYSCLPAADPEAAAEGRER